MMMKILTVLFLLIGGTFAQSSGCREKNYAECRQPDNIRLFPETKREMDGFCLYAVNNLNCMYDAAKKCDDTEDEEVLVLKSLIVYLDTELCNEDSHLYKTISNNLQCISKTVQKLRGICSGPELEEKKQIMTSAVGNPLIEDNDVHPLKVQSCVHLLFKFACGTMTFEEACGEDVGEAFTNVALHLDPYFGSCPPEVLGQLPNAINALRSAVNAEEEAVNAIKRRRK